MKDFLQVKSWFENKYKEKSASRYVTFKLALNLFLQRHGHTIVELGTTKHEDDWGAGMGTLLFAEAIGKYGGKIYTVDNYLPHIEACKRVTSEWADKIKYVYSDSLEFLRGFKEKYDSKVDLLYLDTLDYPLTPQEGAVEPCQEHQLEELKLAYPNLSSNAVVLLDDNDLPGGGKTRLSKEFLFKKGWHLLADEQQSLWVRK